MSLFYKNVVGKLVPIWRCPHCDNDPVFMCAEQADKVKNRIEGIFYMHCGTCGEINTLEGPVKQLTAEGASMVWNDLVLSELCSRAVKSCTEFMELFGRNK